MATFATLEEAWGSTQLAAAAALPTNPYREDAFQRQVLGASVDVAIRPREPQSLAAPDVKAYLERLHEDSGPAAVSALLPAAFHAKPQAPAQAEAGRARAEETRRSLWWQQKQQQRRRRGGSDSPWDDFMEAAKDPENVFFVLVAAFAVLVIADSL